MATPTKITSPDDWKQLTMGGIRPCAKFLLVASVIFTHSHLILGHDYFWSQRSPVIKVTDVDQDEEFSTSEGGFIVLFPKKPTESFSTLKVENTAVKVHTYSVRDKNTYEISYFDVPHASDNPKVIAALLLGLRNYVLAKLKGTLVSDAPVWLDNNEGRLLEISVPNRGIARAIIIVTETRLYRITVVPEKLVESSSSDAANSAASRFLKSFRLLAIDRSGEGEVEAFIRKNPELARKVLAVDNRGAFLNGRALLLPYPEYPEPARMARVSGTVIVKIVIDEAGNVIAAQAISGHPSLQPAAVNAARRARFTPTLEQGRPVKVLGQVEYNFVWR